MIFPQRRVLLGKGVAGNRRRSILPHENVLRFGEELLGGHEPSHFFHSFLASRLRFRNHRMQQLPAPKLKRRGAEYVHEWRQETVSAPSLARELCDNSLHRRAVWSLSRC